MTALQKLKRHILERAIEKSLLPELTDKNVDDVYDQYNDQDQGPIQDARSEVRSSGIDTDIKCDWSRHYESKSVADQMSDGSWVGWTYWYGGGKHGEPEAIDWLEHAYDLDVTDEEKVMRVLTFKKK